MEVGKITEYFLQGIYGTSLEISRGIISLLFLFFKKKKLYLAVAHLSPPPFPFQKQLFMAVKYSLFRAT